MDFARMMKFLTPPISNGTNRVDHPAPRAMVGIGFVILSREIDPVSYVEKCYRNKLLTIITDRNEIIKDCYVERNVWQYINFPKNVKEKGSLVIWINPPQQNKPVIIGVMSKRDELLPSEVEHSFNFSRQTEFNSVSIEGLGEDGILNISLDGETEENTKMIITLLNSMSKAIFDLYVQGDINIEGDNDLNLKLKHALNINLIDENSPEKYTNINYTLRSGLTISDEFNNKVTLNNGGMIIEVEKVDKITLKGIDNVVEPALLGNTTKKVLNELNDNVKNLTTYIQTALASGSYAAYAASLTPQLIPLLTEINKVSVDLETIIAKNVEVS